MGNIRSLLKTISVLTFLLIPILIFAQQLEKDKFQYKINDDGTITILGYTGKYDEKIIIPDSIDGKAVTIIGKRAFAMNNMLKSVEIPQTITRIEDTAFHMTALENVFIPKSVKYIGGSAFYECRELQHVVIESGSEIIFGDGVFDGTEILDDIKDENGNILGNAEYIVRNNTIIYYRGIITWQERHVTVGVNRKEYTRRSYTEPEEIIIPAEINGQKITAIGDYAFRYKTNLKKVVIPQTVTSIGKYAFAGCGKLTNIVIPSSITKIEDGAFSGCINLVTINLPNGITSIGNNVFAKCEGLLNITIPTGVTSLGSQLFSECMKLEKVVIPRTVTYVGDQMFESTFRLTQIVDENGNPWGDNNFAVINGIIVKCLTEESNVTIPQKIDDVDIVKIAGGAFYLKRNLKSITIPDNITEISQNAFMFCNSLKEVVLGNLTAIAPSTFAMCRELKTIEIPSSVTSIGAKAFMSTGLTKIVIPEGVESIGPESFGGCSNLTEVYLPESLNSIDRDAFKGSNRIIIFTKEGSRADNFAKERNIKVEYIQ